MHAPARGQPRPQPAAELAGEPGADQELVLRRLGVGRRLLLGRQEVLGKAGHRAGEPRWSDAGPAICRRPMSGFEVGSVAPGVFRVGLFGDGRPADYSSPAIVGGEPVETVPVEGGLDTAFGSVRWADGLLSFRRPGRERRRRGCGADDAGRGIEPVRRAGDRRRAAPGQAPRRRRALLRVRRAHERAREDRLAPGVLERRPAAGTHGLVQQPLHVDPVRALADRRPGARRLLRQHPPGRDRPRQGGPRARHVLGRGRRPRPLRDPRADARRRARALHRADGAHTDAAAVGARQPAVALELHERRRAARDRRRLPVARDPLRRAVPRHRLHGRLPRLHVGRRALPGPGRTDLVARRRRVPGGDDRRPGREGRHGLRRLSRRPRARLLLRDAVRRGVPQRRLARPLRVPGLLAGGGAHVVGRAARAPARRRRGGRVVRHERAGAVRAAAVDDAGRRRAQGRRAPAASRRGPQRVRAVDGAGDARRARALARNVARS